MNQTKSRPKDTPEDCIVDMPYNPYAMKIHIDGSAYKNPGGAGGIAAIVEYPDVYEREPEMILQLGFSETTNQRMELRACIEALKWARDNVEHSQCRHVIIITDSRYVCDNQHRAQFWKKSSWRNQAGRPVDNSDLWDDLLKAKTKVGIRTDIEWHKGKGTALGKEVDAKAKQSAKADSRIRDRGFQFGKTSRTKLPGITAQMYHASGQQEIIRIYRKGSTYQGTVRESKIFFEVYSESESTYASKHFAYTSLQIEAEVHRGHLYRAQFNSNPKYPIIEAILEEVKLA